MPTDDDNHFDLLELDSPPQPTKRQPIQVVATHAPHEFVPSTFKYGERGGQFPSETCAICQSDQRAAIHRLHRLPVAYALPQEPFPTDHSALSIGRQGGKSQVNAALDAHFANMAPALAAINAGMLKASEIVNPPYVPMADIPEHLTDGLSAIAAESQANAATQGIGSMETGEMRGVGFTSEDGYVQAIRNGVPATTHAAYCRALRVSYYWSDSAIAALPGPMAETSLPVDANPTVHTPTGPSVFDRPRAERQFIVGAKSDEDDHHAHRRAAGMRARELVAGAVAEGHHAIFAWEGTSGVTRAALVAELTTAGLQGWAPEAASARSHAGIVIHALANSGMHVKAQRKSGVPNSGLASGEHVWTVGKVGHQAEVGSAYGEVKLRFTLRGDVLSFEGDQLIGADVILAFSERMSSEVFKSSDLTHWLANILRRNLDAVAFGALGWLVPARHVAVAKALCNAAERACFGADWVDGLPVATSDQLRNGIVRGLTAEVQDVLATIQRERDEAAELRRAALETCDENGIPNLCGEKRVKVPSGDIGERRATAHLASLRAIAARVVGYGNVLGEERVAQLQIEVREAMASLQLVLGEDHSGIRERFSLIWEEIELDRSKNGGVL